jgi:hypothetical protein
MATAAFVGRRRAGVRRTRDEDDDTAAPELGERSGSARDAGERPDVVPVLDECGHEVGARDGTERDDEAIRRERARTRLGESSCGVDRRDLRLDELDPVPLEQPTFPAALGHGRVADELPELAQPHRESGLAVDEDDLVLWLQAP